MNQNGDPVTPPEGLWLTSSTLPTTMTTGAVDLSPSARGVKNNPSECGPLGGLDLLMSAEWTGPKSEGMSYGPYLRTKQRSMNPPSLSSNALNTLITDLAKCQGSEWMEDGVVPSSSHSRFTEPPNQPVVNLASDWSPGFTERCIEGCHRVAIEADGPYHFHQSPEGYSLTGSTHLKRRQLAAMGWKVLPVSSV